MPDENLPPPEQLQFSRAQPIDGGGRVCVACKQIIPGDYFQANGNTVCAGCAERIRTNQQAAPGSLARAALFGTGAALAGSAIYAAVGIFLHLEIGLIAILIGYMVGKSIRYASGGGRSQQILAVLLTYFSITSAFIWTILYTTLEPGHSIDWSRAMIPILKLLIAAPFLSLFQGSLSALISLVIIFVGLRQAWHLTAQSRIAFTGPHSS